MGTELEDGWEFWTRVYSDPVLKNQLDALNQDEPYLSEILSDQKLLRTKVIVDHLPKNCSNQELKNLLEAKVGSATIINVRIKGYRGFVNFYRADDAETVVEHFDHKPFRGRSLAVRLDSGPQRSSNSFCIDEKCDDDASFVSLKSVDAGIQSDSGPQTGGDGDNSSVEAHPAARVPSELSLNGDAPDTHATFIESLSHLLESTGPLVYSDDRITALLLRQPVHVQLVYFCWPLGAFRTRTNLRLVGGYLCLLKDEIVALDFCSTQGRAFICRDTWEPMAPSQIWNNSDLAKYAVAFLKHFGPSWIRDLPFIFLVHSLACSWRRDPLELAEIIERERPDVQLIYDTLYLTTLPHHRSSASRAICRGPC